ncbi:MAG: thiosulfate oxidation carrier protein SoxY, partial [Comamonas sp.]
MKRRDALKNSAAVLGLLVAAGVLPQAAHAAYNKAAFEAKTMAEVLKALGASAPAESKDVTLTAPDIAENGAVVPIGAATTLPNVKQLLILVEKNPNTMIAAFTVNEALESNFLTRAKLGQSS